MKKNKEINELPIQKPPFMIFQFEKIEGIRGKQVYKTDRFVSPIFGTRVKDVVTVPFTVKNTGDTKKRFDAFRTKHKMSDQEAIEKYGTKYYEFTNIVSHTTRDEIFGPSDYNPHNEPVKKAEEERKMMTPIGFGKQETKEKPQPRSYTDIPFQTGTVEKPKQVFYTKPIEAEYKKEEPKVETYKREKQQDLKDIIASDFGSAPVEKNTSEQKPFKPLVEKERYEYPTVSMFSKKDRD